MPDPFFLVVHFAATLYMTGVIWFVQLVHYPLMAEVGRKPFIHYSREHQRRTTWVVALPMLIEAASAGAILWYQPAMRISWWFLAAGLLLFAVWVSTAVIQMPTHGKLAKVYDSALLQSLVRWNWIRTLAWSLRSLFIAVLFF